jgi:DNA-binding MarR family transcriptional regulator
MAAKSPRKTDGFDLSQNPSHLLRICWQHANDLFAQESSMGELTKPQFMVLAAVEKHEGISQTALVEMTGIDRSTLAEMMRRMLDRGLLHRERTESDARANAVRITGAGKKALRAARAANERVEKAILAAVPPADRPRLIRLLSAIAAHAEAANSKGRRARRRPPR